MVSMMMIAKSSEKVREMVSPRRWIACWTNKEIRAGTSNPEGEYADWSPGWRSRIAVGRDIAKKWARVSYPARQ